MTAVGAPWWLAEQVGARVAGEGPAGALSGDLTTLCADGAQRVMAATGMTPAAPLPPPEAVERNAWVSANLRSMAVLADPLVARIGREAGSLGAVGRGAGGTVLAVEAGALTGLLGQRVLGQYELVLTDPGTQPRLLFVRPNLVEAARRLDVDAGQFLAWVAFHEVTHAVQFAAAPWLQGHLGDLLGELLASLDLRAGDRDSARRLPPLSDLRTLVERVREGGLVLAVAGPERRAILERVQAAMALVEGHAEHVMDLVGADALPDLARLRRALDRRRRERPVLMVVLEKLLGLDLKMRQYRDGRAFCDAVAAAGGPQALRHAFSGPDAVPTMAELADPPAWLRRTGAPRSAARGG